MLAHSALKEFITNFYSKKSWDGYKYRGHFKSLEDIRSYVATHPHLDEYKKIYYRLDQEWKNANKLGCDVGTEAHDAMELRNSTNPNNCHVKNVFGKFKVRDYIHPNFEDGDFCQEFLMYNDRYEISGKPDKCVFLKLKVVINYILILVIIKLIKMV